MGLALFNFGLALLNLIIYFSPKVLGPERNSLNLFAGGFCAATGLVFVL